MYVGLTVGPDWTVRTSRGSEWSAGQLMFENLTEAGTVTFRTEKDLLRTIVELEKLREKVQNEQRGLCGLLEKATEAAKK